jgi:hypothetical protein
MLTSAVTNCQLEYTLLQFGFLYFNLNLGCLQLFTTTLSSRINAQIAPHQVVILNMQKKWTRLVFMSSSTHTNNKYDSILSFVYDSHISIYSLLESQSVWLVQM